MATEDTNGGAVPSSLSDFSPEEVKDLLAKINKLGKGLDSLKKQVGNHEKEQPHEADLTESWRVIGSGEITSDPETEDRIFELPQDVYSFLATYSLKSQPFWLAVIVVFGFQHVLLFLLLANQVDFASDNALNLPENVDVSVRVSQAMLLIIAMFQQDDLLVGIETIAKGVPSVFLGIDNFKHISHFQWNVASLCRMSTGLLGLLAAFVLSIQSDNVFDVLLNVLGVEFVSNLDNVAFDLGAKGYFGRYVKRATKHVTEATFHREREKVWFKRVLHIIIALFILFAALGGLFVIFYRQDSNFLLAQAIQVQFPDEIVPFLGLFSGCYTASTKDTDSRRLGYVQDGLDLAVGGKFGFCSDFGNGESGWTFFVGEFRDPCGSYIVRSEDTTTFNLLEAGHTLEWYPAGDDDENIGDIKIREVTEDNRELYCGKASFETSVDVCPAIQARSQSMYNLIAANLTSVSTAEQVDLVMERDVLDAAVSHTIYYGQSVTVPGAYNIMFFAGRRWVWARTDQINGLRNISSPSEISDYFYSSSESSSSGLFRLLEERLTSGGGNEWVRFISEAVDFDSESPLGLEWYYPLYKRNIDDSDDIDVGSMDYSSVMKKLDFPPPDMSRLLESEFTPSCQFCDALTNPCFFEGICNEETGFCDCMHGTSGALCQDRPLGNGICNQYFNTAQHDYDGGDCCASTCNGPLCGQDDNLDPYIAGGPAYNWLDDSYTGGMFEIKNKDDVWREGVKGQYIAFGVDVAANLTYQFPPLRYDLCIDPGLAAIRIEVLPSVEGSDLIFDGLTVQCEGTTYLRTPIFRVSNYSTPVFSEEIRVPYGAECAFGFQGPGYFRGVSLAEKDFPMPFIQLDQSCSVGVYIPQSRCIWQAFAGSSLSVASVSDVNCDLSVNEGDRRISLADYDALGSDPILEGFCRLDPSQLLERYYVWDILSKGSGELVRASVGHICDGGWNTGVFSVSCNPQRRVRSLALKSGGPQSFVDSMAANIDHLAQLEQVEVQNSAIQVDVLLEALAFAANVTELVLGSDVLPSEIGLIRNLKGLLLTSDLLDSLPTSIGMLTNLEDLESYGTSIMSLPSEIGYLRSLKTLDLGGNKLSSIPTEVGLLLQLQTFSAERNFITSLPSEIGFMGELQQLLVKSNQLSTLPSEIGMMTSLKSIDLANNNLVSLPSELGKLPNLTSIDVTGNINLIEIPREILNKTDLRIYGFDSGE